MVSKNRARVASVAVLGAVAVGCHRSDQPQSSAKQAGDVLAGLRDRLPAGVATGFDAVPRGFRPRFATSDAKTEARVVLPAKSTDPLHVEDARSGLGVDVVLRGARDVAGQAGAGYVAYPRGHVSGATVVHRPLPIGAEDFLSFAERPRVPAVEYDMTVGPGVKGLRLVANTLEMIDGTGMPRLRVSPPYIVGADGAQTDATLAVDGCAVDLNPAGPWGRAPTPPGAATCTVRVSWNDQAVVYPAVLDPRWTTTTSTLNAARQDHTATVLSNGKVLVAGGRNSGTSTAGISNNNAELYDPATGIWTPTDNIASGTGGGGRWFHTATQLPTSSNSATSGMVLIAGGLIAGATTAGAKLYSVTTGHWTTATSMSGTGRDGHTATLLSNGKVLLTGGENVASSTTVLSTAEIYDPSSGSGGWASVATNMAFARKFHTATLLTSSNSNFNNRVLIVGGTTGTASTTSTTSVQVYNISAGTWSTTTALPAARDSHTATALPGGNVLITGGRTNGTPLATALVYTIPSTGTLTSATWPSAGTMSSARWRHTATLLSGTGTSVLVSGGASNSGGTTLSGTPELWNGVTTWTLTATAMATPVQLHTATLLSNGAVLVAGGSNASGNAVASSQLYDPSFGQACTTSSQCVTGFCASGVCCNVACAGTCQSCALTGTVGTCTNVPAGQDPLNQCADNGAAACGTDGFCNGSGACRLYASGTVCVAASCTGSTLTPARTCNGTGTCQTVTNASCTPFVCGTGACNTTCTVDADCVAPFTCNGGSCTMKASGISCTAGSQCASSFCAQGVCCNSACTDQCQACNQAASMGTCSPKPSGTTCDDGNACTTTDQCTATGTCAGTAIIACPGDACRTAGTCNPSTGLCEGSTNVADNTPCDDGNHCSLNDTCHAGTCMPGPTINGCNGAGETYYVPVVNLGSTQGSSYASGINDNGVVTGGDCHSATVIPPYVGGNTVGYVWTASDGRSPIPAPANTSLFPMAINANGMVVGGTFGVNTKLFRYDPLTGTTDVPSAVIGGTANAINDAGQYTGVGLFAGEAGWDAFRAQGSTFEKFAPPSSERAPHGLGIDQAGNVFGFTQRTDPNQGAAFRVTTANVFQVLNTLVPTTSDWDVDPVLGGDYLRGGTGGNATQIIGYGSTGGGLIRGFVLTPGASAGSGTIKKIEKPTTIGNGWVSPRGINQGGEVVGAVMDLSNFAPQRAFMWVDGVGTIDLNTLIDPQSGWVLNAAYGINKNRQVVGSGTLNGVERAFEMDVPNQSPCTAMDACHVAGVRDRRGNCTNPPIADNTGCNDNNACTQNDHCVAGACTGSPIGCPSDFCHAAGTCDSATGFCSAGAAIHESQSCDDGNSCTLNATCTLGTCVPEDTVTGCTLPTDHYYAPLVDIGSTQGASYATDINNDGEVIGVDVVGTYVRETSAGALPANGFRWTPTGGAVTLPRPANGAVFTGGLNSAGVISGTTVDIPTGGWRVFRYDPRTDTQLQILPISTGLGMAINDAGQVTGYGGFLVGGVGLARMFRATGTSIESIPGLPGTLVSQGNAIDGFGDMVGYTLRSDRASYGALRYTDARGLEYVSDLLPAGSDWALDPVSGGDSLAMANGMANGTNGMYIVGSGVTGNALSRAYVMTTGPTGARDGTIKQIPMLATYADNANWTAAARDVNAHGEVVGAVFDVSGFHAQSPFIWVDGTGSVDLNDFVDPASGWVLKEAFAINDSRYVAGWGYLNNQQRAFRMKVPDLSPCPQVACHAQPLRDLRTGQCPSTPAVADGASCDDGNACTSNDTCQEGACSGGPLDVSCALDPRVEGVTTVNGEQLGVFSYDNAVFQNVNIPYGGQNYLTPPGSDPNSAPVSAPPAWFLPGLHRGAFTSPLTNGMLSWTLGTKTVIADEGTSAHLTTMTGPSSSGTVIVLSDGIKVPFDGVAIDLGATIVATAVPNSGVGGTLPGTFDVTDDGEATYRIPLWVPEGKAGLQPQLALTYNSRQGNSIVGLGWRIDGLSTISRCHRITGRDGVTQPIQFTDDDRLCLDGERLVLVGGTYNQAGAEYRTEHDQFMKILQTGHDELGPTGFLVYLPNGLMRSYGNDTNTALTGFHGNATAWLQGNRATMTYNSTDFSDPTVAYSTPARLSWALASVADRYTNRIAYNYAPLNPIAPDFKLDFRISSITYNMPDSGGAGGREIDFEYDQNVFTTTLSRSDVRDSFVSGLPLRLGHVLGQITIHGPDPIDAGVLRRYVMSYQNGNPLLLQSVQECDSAQHCKPSTTFDYTPASFEFERKPTGVGVSPTQGLIPADMDGDGKDDLVYRGLDGRNGRDSVWRYLPSLGTGLGAPITVADVSSDPPALNNPLFNYQQYGARVADMNMDGRADLFVPRVDSSGHSHSQVLISGASGFTPFNTGTDFEAGNLPPWGGSKPVPLYSADFNGDGLPDLMRATSPTIFGVPAEWSHRLSSASSPGAIAGGYTSFFQLIAGSPVNPVFSDMPVDQDWNAYAFDFDGDGKSELLVRQAGGDANGVLAGTRMTILRLPDGSTSSVVPTSLLVSMPGPGNSSYMMLDVNGDGLPDAVEMPNVGGDVRVAINTGSDFLPPVIVRLTAGPVGQNFDGSSPVDPATRAMDFDQDGRADLFLMNEGGCNPLIPPRSHPVVLRSSVQNGAPTFTSQTLSALPVGWPAFQDSCAGFPNSRVLDVNGDGLSDFVQVEPFASAPTSTEVVLYIRSGQKANLLRTATDGLGHRVDVQYKPITDPTVHTPVQCSYPQYCTPHGNTWVVAHHSYDPPADDPTGPPARSYTHTYTGFRSDLTGFGGLGMDQHNQVDDRTTQSVLTTYDHSRDAGSSAGALNPYALLGKIKTRMVTTFISQTLHANIKTWDYTYNVQSSNGGSRLSVTPKSVTFTEVENSPGDPHAPGSVISQTIRNSQVGTTYNPDFGYLTDRTTTINGETKTEGFTFDTDRTDTWLIGQTHRRTIKYDTPARPATQTPPTAAIPAETVTRTTEYHHDPNTGALSDVIIEPDSTDNDIYLATTYVRNPFGQVETTREHKLDGKERTTKATYDPISGVYPYRHINAVGQPLYTVYHPGLGVLVAAVDPNGLTAVRKYDRLGRIREQDDPNGSTAIQTYDLQLGTNGPDGMIVGTTIDGSSSNDFYDRNGRPTVHSSTNDNGDPVSSRTFYDPYGRVTQRVLPYDVALNPNPDFGSMPSIVLTYDELGRQTSLTAGPSSTAWSYDGKTATHIVTSDSGTQSDTSIFDEIGRLVTRVERVGQTATTAAHDVTTRYVYAPFGSIRDVVDTAGNVTHADYDVRGRRRALHEPDSGDTIEHHDAFGNLTSRTDGSNRTVSFVPDPLGRVTVETTTEGDSFFAWDTSANGIGRIGRTTSWDGAVIDVSYFNNGQPGAGQVEGEHWEVDGLGFQIDRTYDSFGRPSVLQYPESDVTTHSRYAVQFNYNPNSGGLQDVRDLTRGSAALYQVTARFPAGQVHEDVTGDEVTTTRDYEPVRRLLTSITSTGSTGDIIQQLGYHYDRRGLMDSRTDLVGDSSGGVTEQFTHDELGRLTRWQGDAGWAVGYTYDDIGNLTQRQATSSSTSDTVIFTPGGGGGGPHALGSLTAGGTTESFSYDPAGRQWQAGNRTVTYTDFDLPRTITSPGVNASFEYDANHRRVVKRTGGATTIYVGGLYELRVVLGMATHVMYVPGEQGNVAQVTQAQGGQPQIDFFHGDHLGSIYSDVGPSGMTAMRFDPFGSRISPGSLRSSPTPTDRPLAEITRGFAGLEHDDELGLINMNGRIYDPATARYLTPDPMVSEPGQSQSFNKYSYAQNSPLMRWDPTGFDDGDVEGDSDAEAGDPDNSGIATEDHGSAVPYLPGGPVPDGCVGACGQQGPTTVEAIPAGADDQGPGGTAPPDWGTASHEGSAGGDTEEKERDLADPAALAATTVTKAAENAPVKMVTPVKAGPKGIQGGAPIDVTLEELAEKPGLHDTLLGEKGTGVGAKGTGAVRANGVLQTLDRAASSYAIVKAANEAAEANTANDGAGDHHKAGAKQLEILVTLSAMALESLGTGGVATVGLMIYGEFNFTMNEADRTGTYFHITQPYEAPGLIH